MGDPPCVLAPSVSNRHDKEADKKLGGKLDQFYYAKGLKGKQGKERHLL